MNKFMMKAFRSPAFETSAWKNIPIEFVDDVQAYLRETYGAGLKQHDLRFLYRYRGQRRRGLSGQMTCLKEDANRFSVYIVGDSAGNRPGWKLAMSIFEKDA